MAKKTKRATKSGRKRTSARRTGARAKRTSARAKRTSARAKRTSPRAKRTKASARRTSGRSAARTAKKSASAVRGDGRSRGGDLAAPGPSMPLRDLIRGGGLPRSRKAHSAGGVTMSPWAARRQKTASGLRSGTTIMQNQPERLEHVGSLRMAIPKR